MNIYVFIIRWPVVSLLFVQIKDSIYEQEDLKTLH